MNLTPKQIVEQLDKYIIGQSEAKKAVAVATAYVFIIEYLSFLRGRTLVADRSAF